MGGPFRQMVSSFIRAAIWSDMTIKASNVVWLDNNLLWRHWWIAIEHTAIQTSLLSVCQRQLFFILLLRLGLSHFVDLSSFMLPPPDWLVYFTTFAGESALKEIWKSAQKGLFGTGSMKRKKKPLFKPLKSSPHLSEECKQRKSQGLKPGITWNTMAQLALSLKLLYGCY